MEERGRMERMVLVGWRRRRKKKKMGALVVVVVAGEGGGGGAIVLTMELGCRKEMTIKRIN
jgi:acetyl-CoA carboxylase alpha subunit